MASLIALTKEGLLPKIQHMDADTLSWIKITGQSSGLKSELHHVCPFPRESMEKYNPEQDWFLNQECYSSLHGIRHIARVIANAANLTINRDYDIKSTRNLLIACALHDVRRQDDKGDMGHSKRATDWLSKNTAIISEHFSVEFTADDLEEISTAIYLHEIPYSDIGNSEEYLQHKDIVDLIKTADALDRYRLPKLSWWINDEFLILKPSLEEKIFAFSLVVNSEKEHLETGESYLSVLNNL